MGSLFSLFGLGMMAAFFSYASTQYPEYHPIINFPQKPVVLAVKKKKGSKEVENMTIKKLIETRCPSFFKEFVPIWWLPNGHFQTLYCVFGDFSKQNLMWYNRQYLRLTDGGTLGLDFAPLDSSRLSDDTPIVVIKHGLTGGSYEPYVRAILSKACAPVELGGLGYRAVVINFRGCAGVPVTSRKLYSAGNTDDIRQALWYITNLYPNAPILGLGFSLGSGVITRYLAEEGLYSRMHSAVVLACPWNLSHNNVGLLSSYSGKYIYSKGMGGNLKNLMTKHKKAFISTTDDEITRACLNAMNLKSPTLETFDDTFTRVAGGGPPHFPFKSAEDYYVWGSSHEAVKDVKVPYLAVNAGDDPVVRHVPMEGGGNGFVVMELTTGGGHLGWFQAGEVGMVDRWTTKPVLEWLKVMGEGLVLDPLLKRRKLFVDGDGYLKEDGWPHLGCKEISGGGVIDGNAGEEGTLQGL